jgi:diadenosine tetraphosphate (Ap4A) HIT family hydrolase
MARFGALLAFLLIGGLMVSADPPMPAVGCPCEHGDAASMGSGVCSLCKTADEQTEDVYFLKDINPNKPNRYLALPKAHVRGLQAVGEMSAPERERVWTAAIQRARELFGERWGLAENSYFFRTQCHAHIHMGPLSPDVKDEGGRLYGQPKDFPAVGAEKGMWVHPKDGKYCVHLDRDLAEIVLVR